MDDFFDKHSETGQLVMLLQEEIVFEEYYVVIALAANMCALCLMNHAIRIICVM